MILSPVIYIQKFCINISSPLTSEIVGAPQMTLQQYLSTRAFHPSLSSAALREAPNSIPVHSLMLSSHLFFCLPLRPFCSFHYSLIDLNSVHLSAHVVKCLLRENRKSIPIFFNGKKLKKNVTLQILNFVLILILNNKKFLHMVQS